MFVSASLVGPICAAAATAALSSWCAGRAWRSDPALRHSVMPTAPKAALLLGCIVAASNTAAATSFGWHAVLAASFGVCLGIVCFSDASAYIIPDVCLATLVCLAAGALAFGRPVLDASDVVLSGVCATVMMGPLVMCSARTGRDGPVFALGDYKIMWALTLFLPAPVYLGAVVVCAPVALLWLVVSRTRALPFGAILSISVPAAFFSVPSFLEVYL